MRAIDRAPAMTPDDVGADTRHAREIAALRARLADVEGRLHDVEERYALATAAALEGIYEWDLAAGRLLLTAQARQFFALVDEAPTPAAWNARIHDEDFDRYRAAIVAHFKGHAANVECEYRIRDGKDGYRWILDRGVGLRDAGGRVTRVVGALSDITARKLAEIDLRQARDRAEEALEQQSAMAEILRVMSQSPTDVQPVFDLVARRAGKLCRAEVAVVSRYDGARIQLAAIQGMSAEAVDIVRNLYPMDARAETVTARTVRSGDVVHIADVFDDRTYAIKEFARAAHFRAGLGVPIVAGVRVIGTIFVGRGSPGLFAASQVDLLKAFADQAAIAIENVRLFNETKETLEQQTATSDILRVMAASPICITRNTGISASWRIRRPRISTRRSSIRSRTRSTSSSA